LATYEADTTGVEAANNTTVRLDALLRILPECGGQTRLDADARGYLEGAPELVAEVAGSSTSIDLHEKRRAYRRSGVREYIVWRIYDEAIDAFVLEADDYVPLRPEAGILRSHAFPGLWLHLAALLRNDLRTALDTVHAGLQSPAHAAFSEQLGSPREF